MAWISFCIHLSTAPPTKSKLLSTTSDHLSIIVPQVNRLLYNKRALARLMKHHQHFITHQKPLASWRKKSQLFPFQQRAPVCRVQSNVHRPKKHPLYINWLKAWPSALKVHYQLLRLEDIQKKTTVFIPITEGHHKVLNSLFYLVSYTPQQLWLLLFFFCKFAVHIVNQDRGKTLSCGAPALLTMVPDTQFLNLTNCGQLDRLSVIQELKEGAPSQP